MKNEIWEKILKKSNTCLCNKDSEQYKVDEKTHQEHRLHTKKEQEELFVDACGNPMKINLRDLHKILNEVKR